MNFSQFYQYPLINISRCSTMDRRTWAQDVLRCLLCETPGPPMYCDICHIHLCKACVGQHIFDQSSQHKVVPFEKRGLNPKCLKHSTQLCDLHCKECDIQICTECVSSGEHLGHKMVGILKLVENKKDAVQRDLQELENTIYPKYQEMASNIPVQRDNLHENSHKLKTDIEKHKEDLHREIDIAIERLKSGVDEIESKHLAFLDKQEEEIKRSISEVTDIIADLNKLLNSSDVCLLSSYKSRNVEFRRVPPIPIVSLSRFIPQKINKEQIYQQIGSLSMLSMKKEQESTGAGSFPLDRPLIDVPRIITDINTEYDDSNELESVSCLSDDDVWACGSDNMMSLFNLKGELVKSIKTKSGNIPGDITVTQGGELVYTDYLKRTVNIVKNKGIKTIISLRSWKPLFVCSALSGDLLVVMITDDNKEAKVARYSGSTEKQSIQFNEMGQPLYSLQNHTKYICENKNLDICVADSYPGSPAVVVVNQAGKFRFNYTGFPLILKKPFEPVGITTDIQLRILTSDYNNNYIHILDQDGQFLRYIDNCQINHPNGLCVDSRDNLFVADGYSGKIKKIQYYI
ncbi:uncharacterized protein LOC128184586 [Crassostrea angulata]|uniref:uncharacterized protein LOC128184586 n=1 Tax=Magallana angulata TaxID=2784310 RepID=UPI0022B219A1|nr:uncharacterized protein LOC128184586 [Crassostrea angulata]